MNNLAHYVRVYDDVFDSEFCNGMIENFDIANSTESPAIRTSEYDWKQDYRCFTEIDITQEASFEQYLNPYYARIDQVYNHYKSVVQETFFPDKYAHESARLKMYHANDYDQFGWHVDVGDKNSASRFLVMFTYLNDVEEGGVTRFKSDLDFTITPKQGRIVVFPPMWMFPHIGEKPVSNSKYILSTYLHYT